jgi:hypothetical protein
MTHEQGKGRLAAPSVGTYEQAPDPLPRFGRDGGIGPELLRRIDRTPPPNRKEIADAPLETRPR